MIQEIHDKASLVHSLWYWCWNSQTENPEVEPSMYENLLYDQNGSLIPSKRMDYLLNNDTIGEPSGKLKIETSLSQSYTIYQKNNYRWMIFEEPKYLKD